MKRTITMLGVAVVTMALAIPAMADGEFTIELERKVIREAPGTAIVLANAGVPEDLVGETCQIEIEGNNNQSVHMDNNIVVGSSNTVTLANVERAPNAVTTTQGLRLAAAVQVVLELGPDGVYSAQFTMTFRCQGSDVTTTTIAETTTTTDGTTTTEAGSAVWYIESSCDAYTVTIGEGVLEVNIYSQDLSGEFPQDPQFAYTVTESMSVDAPVGSPHSFLAVPVLEDGFESDAVEFTVHPCPISVDVTSTTTVGEVTTTTEPGEVTELPFTGPNDGPGALVAGGLILAGAAILGLSQRLERG